MKKLPKASNRTRQQNRKGIIPSRLFWSYCLPFVVLGDAMKKIVWLFVIRWMRNSFVGMEGQEPSTIVDICTYLEDYFVKYGVQNGN